MKNVAQSHNYFMGSSMENVSVHEGSSLRWLEAEEVTHSLSPANTHSHTHHVLGYSDTFCQSVLPFASIELELLNCLSTLSIMISINVCVRACVYI